MKYLLLLSVMLASPALAEDCTSSTSAEEATSFYDINTNVPNHLKGATITIRQADGKESTVPAEKFKVVPRVQQYIIKTAEQRTKTSCTVSVNDKNRVSLVGGYGSRNKLDTSTNGTTVSVENSRGLVGGLQYQRLLTRRLSVGAQGQTNKTGSLLIGLDF
jgi:hypothetical protein